MATFGQFGEDATAEDRPYELLSVWEQADSNC
jgi:hypothetical protein